MQMTPEHILAALLQADSPQSAPEVNALLRSIWPQIHAPHRSHGGAELVALFQRAGYVSDRIPRPDSEITVYRGELAQAHEPGISWTTDLQVAERYARNYATVGHTQVIRAVAPPAAVLGRFAQDAEVVVVPDMLRDLKTVGYVHHFTLPRLAPF